MADVRNEADQICYVVEQHLEAGANKVRETNRSNATAQVAALRKKLTNLESIDEIKKGTADLRALLAMIQQDISTPTEAQANSHSSSSNNSSRQDYDQSNGDASAASGEDIVDAEVTAA
jgi:hypothetical protein